MQFNEDKVYQAFSEIGLSVDETNLQIEELREIIASKVVEKMNGVKPSDILRLEPTPDELEKYIRNNFTDEEYQQLFATITTEVFKNYFDTITAKLSIEQKEKVERLLSESYSN